MIGLLVCTQICLPKSGPSELAAKGRVREKASAIGATARPAAAAGIAFIRRWMSTTEPRPALGPW